MGSPNVYLAFFVFYCCVYTRCNNNIFVTGDQKILNNELPRKLEIFYLSSTPPQKNPVDLVLVAENSFSNRLTSINMCVCVLEIGQLTCSLYSTWTFFMMRQCFCRIEMAWANGIPGDSYTQTNAQWKENPYKHDHTCQGVPYSLIIPLQIYISYLNKVGKLT